MRFAPTIALAVTIATPALAALTVQPSRTAFNPSLRESVTYTVQVDSPGTLTAVIVDRDLYATKTLVRAQRVNPGTIPLTWDGTDAAGRTVADEAWSVKIDLQTASGTETYFPAFRPAEMIAIKPDMYDASTGVLRYTLPTASRIHLEAGIADRASKNPTAGAVMKTIVNREPRPPGAIVEQWTGMDESGTVYVPALRNFVVAIAATPLPENSVITYGNRRRKFLDTALQRHGPPLVMQTARAHHQGLSALGDIAPRLTVTPVDAQWSADTKTWFTRSRRLRCSIATSGQTADHFVRQPGRLFVYVDQKRAVDAAAGPRSFSINLPHDSSPHIVAVNWVSAYGPVAATVFRVQTAR